MNPDPTSWTFFQWATTVTLTVVTAVFGYMHRRIGSNETLIRNIEQGLKDDIAVAMNKATENRDDLRREIQDSLRTISSRLDLTPTRNDMMDIISLAIDRKIQH